jgi:hypothetical protein
MKNEQKLWGPAVGGVCGALVAILVPTPVFPWCYLSTVLGGLVAGFISYRRGWVAGLIVGLLLVLTTVVVFNGMQSSLTEVARSVGKPAPHLHFDAYYWIREFIDIPLGCLAGYLGGGLRVMLGAGKRAAKPTNQAV